MKKIVCVSSIALMLGFVGVANAVSVPIVNAWYETGDTAGWVFAASDGTVSASDSDILHGAWGPVGWYGLPNPDAYLGWIDDPGGSLSQVLNYTIQEGDEFTLSFYHYTWANDTRPPFEATVEITYGSPAVALASVVPPTVDSPLWSLVQYTMPPVTVSAGNPAIGQLVGIKMTEIDGTLSDHTGWALDVQNNPSSGSLVIFDWDTFFPSSIVAGDGGNPSAPGPSDWTIVAGQGYAGDAASAYVRYSSGGGNPERSDWGTETLLYAQAPIPMKPGDTFSMWVKSATTPVTNWIMRCAEWGSSSSGTTYSAWPLSGWWGAGNPNHYCGDWYQPYSVNLSTTWQQFSMPVANMAINGGWANCEKLVGASDIAVDRFKFVFADPAWNVTVPTGPDTVYTDEWLLTPGVRDITDWSLY